MKNLALGLLIFCLGSAAVADEVQYNCAGVYNSKQKGDESDPESVSVRASLKVVMLGDENENGQYAVRSLDLEMFATNLSKPNVNAGNYHVQSLVGVKNRAIKEKYKNYIRINLDGKITEAYSNTFDVPVVSVLIPTNDSNVVYIQRTYSGHDAYPTLRLKCK